MDRKTALSRRDMLAGGLAAAAATGVGRGALAAQEAPPREPFGYCLNTGTIRGQRLTLVEEIELAAKAGYGAIEPWVGSIRRHRESGGSLADLKKRIADLGLKVPGAMGFARWLVDDEARRRQGLERAKEDMDIVRQIGGTGMAAPPAGMRGPVDLLAAAERYRALLEIGKQMSVVPRLEIWGPSRALSRIGQAAFVAIESGHPDASLLLDVYHIYKGGSEFTGLKMLSAASMAMMHVNDYPADPPRETINDSHRVYPGDGVAPLTSILATLRGIGFRGWLSLELFNRDYWKRPAMDVAKTGLAKMKAAVAKSLM